MDALEILRRLAYPLKKGMEFDTQRQMDTYLKEHPGADRRNHSVKQEWTNAERGEFDPSLRGDKLEV